MFADVAEEMKSRRSARPVSGQPNGSHYCGGMEKARAIRKLPSSREQLEEVNVAVDGLLAIVSMKPIEASVPCIDRDDIAGLAKLIIQHYPKPPSS